jgi:phage gpG-like protein
VTTAGAGIHVEIDGVMRGLKEVEDLIAAKERDIYRYGRGIMRSETRRAFSQKVDPNTGRAWPERRGSYPWAMLNRTGALMASLDWSYGTWLTGNRRPRFFGKVKGGQAEIVKAGAVHFGRSKGRSSRGTRLSTGPTTGATPAREIFGFGRSARRRIKRYAEKRIARVFA